MPSADTTTATTQQTDLWRLGFNHIADQLNDHIAEGTRKRWSATVLLVGSPTGPAWGNGFPDRSRNPFQGNRLYTNVVGTLVQQRPAR